MEIENKKKFKIVSSSGFSLMEVMLSVAILSLGIVASFTLIASSMAVFSNATNKIIAANLAQDGIERVRQVRDTNWLQGDDWDDRIKGDVNPRKTIKFFCMDAGESDNLMSLPSDINDCGSNCQIYIYKDGRDNQCYSDNFNGNPISAGYGSTATNFYRFIRLAKKTDINSNEYIEVTVDVKWTKGGQNYILPAVKENLYNWKETP